MYSRLLQITSLPHDQSFFLFGPRATGKSSLVQSYLDSYAGPSLIYDLLRSDTYLRLQSTPSLLRQEIDLALKKNQGGPPLQVHLDEVQKVPALLDEVHSLIESYPGRVRFILTGSSARKLKRGGANLLAGRAWERHLFPLTSLEMGDDFILEDTLQYGTLPPVTGRDAQAKREVLQAYVMTYLKEEIQAEAITRRLDSFHRFLEAAARCNGELVNLSAIAQEAQIPRTTVGSYYQILEDTLLGFFLPSWGHRLSRKDLVTHGKFYFFDPGIVAALILNLTADIHPKHPLFGRLFEHFCILEFHRLHAYKNTEHKVGFFRTRAGAEVDLIQERHGKIRAIEIKSTPTVTRSQIRGLGSFAGEFPDAELIVVCSSPREFEVGKVSCIPWQDFFRREWEMA